MDQNDRRCQQDLGTSTSLDRKSTCRDSEHPNSDARLLVRFQRELEVERERWRSICEKHPESESARDTLREYKEKTPEQMLASYREEQRVRITAEWQRQFDRFIAARGERYRDCRLMNYHVAHDGQQKVVDTLRDYGNNMRQRVADGIGLLLLGPSGTGKDHLLAALVRVAIKCTLKIQWTSGPQLFSSLRAAMSSRELDQEHEILRRMVEVDVLYLSDLISPSGRLTEFQSEFVFAVIDQRYNHQKPTWFSANVPGRPELETALSVPVVDRLVHGAIVLPCNWPSYRKAIPQAASASAKS